MAGSNVNKFITNGCKISLSLNILLAAALVATTIMEKMTPEEKPEPTPETTVVTKDPWTDKYKAGEEKDSLCVSCEYLMVDYDFYTLYDRQEGWVKNRTCCVDDDGRHGARAKDIIKTISKIMEMEDKNIEITKKDFPDLGWWFQENAAHLYVNAEESIKEKKLRLLKDYTLPMSFSKDLTVNVDGFTVSTEGLYFIYSALTFKQSGSDFAIYHSIRRDKDGTNNETIHRNFVKMGGAFQPHSYYTSFVCALKRLTSNEPVVVWATQQNSGRNEQTLRNLHHGRFSSYVGIVKIR